MASPRLIVLLCVTMGASTVSIGAFPALLPEIGSSARLADWQLGAVAGAFGLARMLTDVPGGLFITHHLTRALLLGPAFVIAGALVLAAGGDFVTLLLGRTLMGVGHTLGTLAGLTAILRHRAGAGLASALAATELSAMVGVLGGALLVGILPRAVPWPVALLLACSPMLASLAWLAASVRTVLPRSGDGPRPLFARSEEAPASSASPAPPVRSRAQALLAAVAGTAIAVSYSTVDQFLIPVRGSREFGLDRAGLARLLMLSQVFDIAALLPLGRLADARGARPVLGVVLLVFALAMALLGFGPLPVVVAGCALFGFSMAAWTLPLGILRAATPPAQVAWRIALYRVAVDGGMFLGPFLSGVLAAQHARVVPGVLTVVLAAVGVALLSGGRLTARWR